MTKGSDSDFMRGMKAGFVLAGKPDLTTDDLAIIMASKLFPEATGLNFDKEIRSAVPNGKPTKHKLSADARARIAEAQRARWAKWHKAKRK